MNRGILAACILTLFDKLLSVTNSTETLAQIMSSGKVVPAPDNSLLGKRQFSRISGLRKRQDVSECGAPEHLPLTF